MSRMLLVLGGVALIALGSAGTYFVMTRSEAPSTTTATVAKPDTRLPRETAAVENTLTLSNDAIARAGIVFGTAASFLAPAELRIPAVVEPNAYRAVVVTPITAGRITRVSAELGQSVRRGEMLAQIYSPELVETQSRYLAAKAGLAAHERELRRTEKLAEIGSASRQELENVHAEHMAVATAVQSLRSRLALLGLSGASMDKLTSQSDIVESTSIPAPIDGVITARTANVGLNVDPAMALFTVVDLSTVWLVGDVYERDFSRVRIGSSVTVTTSTYPDVMGEGKVSYIDPAINSQTRTARVRVEVPNPAGRLRLGMYAEMRLPSKESVESKESRVVVARDAVQIVGDRSVVYLADAAQAGRFVERVVDTGAAVGDQIEVLSGLRAGDRVVTKGSFALRAERERLGLPQPALQQRDNRSATDAIRIAVSEMGFEPSRVFARAGTPLRLTFVRTSDATCATAVRIPSLKIERVLPLNQSVDVEFTPKMTGDIPALLYVEAISQFVELPDAGVYGSRADHRIHH